MALAEARKTLSEIESKALLSAFGIRTTIPQPAYSADDAVQIARELGYPIFLKINSSQIVHKTEVQSVVLGVASDEEMKLAFNDMTARAKRLRPDADVHDIKVQAIRPKCRRIGRSNCRRSMSGSHGAFSIHCACPSSGISSSTVKLMAFSFEILYLRITAREFAMKFA